MLLRYEVANHRSIMDSVELSMVAVDEDRPAARTFDNIAQRVLTVAGIYGANASGKSNVLDAIGWLSTAVRTSLRQWDEVVPREPFRFASGPRLASSYEVEMMVENVRYIYALEVNNAEILFEALYSYPERRRRTLFERTGMDIQFRRGISALGGTRELLTPTTLALSAAMRLDAEDIRSFGNELSHISVIGSSGVRRPRGLGSPFLSSPMRYVNSTSRLFQTDRRQAALPGMGDPTDRFGGAESALALLRFADLGIDDVEVVEEVVADGEGRDIRRSSIRLLHRSGTTQIPFDLHDESTGTRTWFHLIGPILRALETGQILLLDEIDANLHPKLSARLLELFKDPLTNRYGAQLIFTTHDTSLLGHMNRDEVWLTEKGGDGATRLIALAEFGGDKVRRSLNLEKAYLQGRFGGVPEFDQHILLDALSGEWRSPT